MTVELALLSPLLVALLFGGFEVAMMARTVVMTGYAADQGRRAAAIGKTPSEITQSVLDGLSGLSPERTTVVCDRRSIDPATGEASAWTRLSAGQRGNDAQGGEEIRIRVSYRHRLLFGGNLLDVASDDGDITLTTDAIARREGNGASQGSSAVSSVDDGSVQSGGPGNGNSGNGRWGGRSR
jgi:hypothetical protein